MKKKRLWLCLTLSTMGIVSLLALIFVLITTPFEFRLSEYLGRNDEE